jgi:hypothetical protein
MRVFLRGGGVEYLVWSGGKLILRIWVWESGNKWLGFLEYNESWISWFGRAMKKSFFNLFVLITYLYSIFYNVRIFLFLKFQSSHSFLGNLHNHIQWHRFENNRKNKREDFSTQHEWTKCFFPESAYQLLR